MRKSAYQFHGMPFLDVDIGVFLSNGFQCQCNGRGTRDVG